MIEFSQGDDVVAIRLQATDGDGNPIALTGASFVSSFKSGATTYLTLPTGQHAADADQTAVDPVAQTGKGWFTLTLSAANTNALPVCNGKEIVTQITQGSSVINYHGVDILNVKSSLPLV